MFISDLTYLETVSEASTIVGGRKRGHKGWKRGGNGPRNANTQTNTIEQSITQTSKAASLAVGEGATSGNVVAVNFGVNFAQIEDNDQALLDNSF